LNIFIGGFRGFLVHGIAGGSRAEMGQARAGQMQMRRIRMGDRRKKCLRIAHRFKIDNIAKTMGLDHRDQRSTRLGRFHGQRIDAGGIVDDAGLAADLARRDDDAAVVALDLRNKHGIILSNGKPQAPGLGFSLPLSAVVPGWTGRARGAEANPQPFLLL
jgi:hypothetical protein